MRDVLRERVLKKWDCEPDGISKDAENRYKRVFGDSKERASKLKDIKKILAPVCVSVCRSV